MDQSTNRILSELCDYWYVLCDISLIRGHVDAGKSTLMGRLLYELKQVDGRTLQKYRQESQKSGKGSFALAWIMDQSDEERKR